MEFLGVGPAELILILVVALIFVGPERLPRLAADIARTIREVRKYTGSIAAEFTEVLQEFEKDTADDRGQWKEIGQGLTDATRSVTDALKQAHSDAANAGATPDGAPAASPGGAAAPAHRQGAAPADVPPAAPAPGGANGSAAEPVRESASEAS